MSYFTTTKLYLKSVSFIYYIAFLSAYNDWDALLGSEGLTPAHLYINKLKKGK